MRVLIADDSRTERLILTTRLEKWGYDVVQASNGDEALEQMLSPSSPRLAILDWMMPGITGPEIVRIVRKERQEQYIYMILVTALGTTKDIIKGLEAGADDYITKPVHGEELKVRLRSGARLVEAWTDLESSEKRTQSIIDSAGDAIFLINSEGSIQYLNPKATSLCAIADTNLVGLNFFDLLVSQDDHQLISNRINTLTNTSAPPGPHTEPERFEISLVRKGGEPTTVLLSMVPLIFEGLPAISLFMTDITERKRLEIDLRHAQKMKAVGQLAAGIAHEINTPIQFIGDSITYLQESYIEIQKLFQIYRNTLLELTPTLLSQHKLKEIQALEESIDLEFQHKQIPKAFMRTAEGLERVTHIVQAMKEFARKDQGSQMAPANLNHALQSTLAVAINEYRYVADIALELGKIPPVYSNIGELNQAFLNLIVNASHAIADSISGTNKRGQITISTQKYDLNTVEITIKDTGTGIPKSAQKRLFEPFFTTKEVGRGTGQGLAIAHSIIVDKHNGEIGFQTHQGQGTTFIIRLPIQSLSENSRG